MGEKRFSTVLNEIIQIISYIYTENGKVVKFVVKLVVLIGTKWEEICRYDCYHGKPHKDILYPDGSKFRVVEFDLSNEQALNVAYKDFKDNYNLYVERYLRWRLEK
jgi:hypothetical protein